MNPTFTKDEVEFVNKMYKEAKREEHRRFCLNSSLWRENHFGIDPDTWTGDMVDNFVPRLAVNYRLQAEEKRIELEKHYEAVHYRLHGIKETYKEFDAKQIATRKWLDSIFVQPSLC